jgi:CHAT domain-containing protein
MFAFLPIHAAGLYNFKGVKDFESCCLSDYCIASYTPTLGALLSSQGESALPREDIRLLLAAAPEPFTSVVLPSALEETNLISNIVPKEALIPSKEAGMVESARKWVSTADELIQLLPNATVLHLACHGIQDASNPLDSGFIMQDKKVQVGDLIRLNLPSARLAFLSACETAQGDMERPDESLHLAATMLYVGFKSVIGTMWSMGDIDGPVVAETVYKELFAGEGDVMNFDVVPYALDAAVQKLRAQGLEPSRWAPYIHIGM